MQDRPLPLNGHSEAIKALLVGVGGLPSMGALGGAVYAIATESSLPTAAIYGAAAGGLPAAFYANYVLFDGIGSSGRSAISDYFQGTITKSQLFRKLSGLTGLSAVSGSAYLVANLGLFSVLPIPAAITFTASSIIPTAVAGSILGGGGMGTYLICEYLRRPQRHRAGVEQEPVEMGDVPDLEGQRQQPDDRLIMIIAAPLSAHPPLQQAGVQPDAPAAAPAQQQENRSLVQGSEGSVALDIASLRARQQQQQIRHETGTTGELPWVHDTASGSVSLNIEQIRHKSILARLKGHDNTSSVGYILQ